MINGLDGLLITLIIQIIQKEPMSLLLMCTRCRYSQAGWRALFVVCGQGRRPLAGMGRLC